MQHDAERPERVAAADQGTRLGDHDRDQKRDRDASDEPHELADDPHRVANYRSCFRRVDSRRRGRLVLVADVDVGRVADVAATARRSSSVYGGSRSRR